MKIFIFLFTLLLSVMSNSVSAQVSDEMTAAERKAFQEKLDSLMFVEAEKAILDKDFTLEADKVEFKYGQTAFVNSGSNKASVTISPNFNSNRIPLTGIVVPSFRSRVYKGSSI